MNSSDLLRYLAIFLIGAVAAAGLSVYLIDSLNARPLDSITLSLISFLTGVITTLAGVHAGENANASGAQQSANIIKEPSAYVASGGTPTPPTNGVAH